MLTELIMIIAIVVVLIIVPIVAFIIKYGNPATYEGVILNKLDSKKGHYLYLSNNALVKVTKEVYYKSEVGDPITYNNVTNKLVKIGDDNIK